MYAAMILSAGMGSRMGLGFNKMLYELAGVPIVVLTLKKFLADNKCEQIILVVNEREVTQMTNLLKENDVLDSRIEIVWGGSERQYSVYNGLLGVKSEIVLVHDGARPFVTQEMIDQCVRTCESGEVAIVGVPLKDTIKRVVNNVVIETPNRNELVAVQTPQAAPTHVLRQAHERAIVDNFLGTDEGSLIEKYEDITVRIVEGAYTNIKLTTKEDLILANELLKTV